MKFYFYGLVMLIRKFLLRQNTGKVILWFASKMGVVYIKFAQMLAMQNYGNLFTEEDRVELSQICDYCNPISYHKIIKMVEKEYGCAWNKKFKKIFSEPVGSASISQVHKAILKNGDIVAIKVKRKDITKKINKDIKQINRFVKHFGWIIRFKNYFGSETALRMFLDWIYEETDFEHERENIYRYQKFANYVNGKIDYTARIRVPHVYSKLCTENIIVMEFISSKTINKVKLTKSNKERISKGLNDYVRLSFYALFHDEDVVFHGDPHGGNICVNQNNEVIFLDMGLIFDIPKQEAEFIRQVFFNAYTNHYEKLSSLLLENSRYKKVDMKSFLAGLQSCCAEFRRIPVTNFFINMINLFTKFNIDPPEIFFKMAKAFIALNGINNFVENGIDTEVLLKEQITEFYVERMLHDFEDVFSIGFKMLPEFLKTVLQDGLAKGISQKVMSLDYFGKKLEDISKCCNEVISFFK